MASYEDYEDTQTSDNNDKDTSRQNISIDDVDLKELAEELYELLKRELKIERERSGWFQQNW